MCYKDPGPRCSNHAAKTLDKRRREFERLFRAGEPIEDAYVALADAQQEFDMTPGGFRSLETSIRSLKKMQQNAANIGDKKTVASIQDEIHKQSERLTQGKALRAARLRELKSEDRGDVQERSHPLDPSEVVRLLPELAYGDHEPTDDELDLMKSMREVETPSQEEHRVLWENLVHSDTPSRAIRALFKSGLAEHWYPELHAIKDIPQSEEWHPEGSVGEHSARAMDVAASNATRAGLPADDRRIVVLAALCHDFGKATHTQIHPDGRITSRGHDIAGVKPTTQFLSRLGADEKLQNQVAVLVRTHMRHINPATPASAKRLSAILAEHGLTLNHWACVADADTGGRGSASQTGIGDSWRRFA